METWRYKARSVTKYNPQNFNSEGVFLLNEWTSYSDIGKIIDLKTNSFLSKKSYLEVENNYVYSVKMFMQELNTDKVKITNMHKISDKDDFIKHKDMDLYKFYTKLAEGEYSLDSIELIMKLVLREYIQVTIEIITHNRDSFIYFGFDYYMYFVSDSVDFNKLKNKLINYGMYLT